MMVLYMVQWLERSPSNVKLQFDSVCTRKKALVKSIFENNQLCSCDSSLMVRLD